MPEKAKDKKVKLKNDTSVVKQTTNKSIAKKTTTGTKKSTKTNISSTKKKELKPVITEYYDLPQKYNQTIVKILAQTPKTLFIYWEISDEDIQKYKNQFGENFFETTKPILIVHNDTLNYSFEVEINDFANSWYLHVNDSKSNYRIELGRRLIENSSLKNNDNSNQNYITITSSNKIESPNDHILFDKKQKMVYFRNVKTDSETTKSLASLSFIKNIGKLYETYDLYQELYKNEETFANLTNPSSQFK